MRHQRHTDHSSAFLFWIGVALLTGGLWLMSGALSDARDANAGAQSLVAPGCKQSQRIEYTRCGHEVLRRIDAPDRWIGMDQEGVLRALDEGWRMTDFSPNVIEMACAPDLFCPQHWVLTLSEDGAPGIYRNRTGFAMERVADAAIRVPDEEMRALLAQGVTFDSREALLSWAKQFE